MPILAQVITCDICCFSQRVLHGVRNPCSHRSVMQWGRHMRCPYVYFLCLAGRVLFSTRAPVQSFTTANQQRIYTRILCPNFCAGPRPLKAILILPNWFWLNPESERTTEIKFPPCVGFEPTTAWSTAQRVTTEPSPLSKQTDSQTDRETDIHIARKAGRQADRRVVRSY